MSCVVEQHNRIELTCFHEKLRNGSLIYYSLEMENKSLSSNTRRFRKSKGKHPQIDIPSVPKMPGSLSGTLSYSATDAKTTWRVLDTIIKGSPAHLKFKSPSDHVSIPLDTLQFLHGYQTVLLYRDIRCWRSSAYRPICFDLSRNNAPFLSKLGTSFPGMSILIIRSTELFPYLNKVRQRNCFLTKIFHVKKISSIRFFVEHFMLKILRFPHHSFL